MVIIILVSTTFAFFFLYGCGDSGTSVSDSLSSINVNGQMMELIYGTDCSLTDESTYNCADGFTIGELPSGTSGIQCMRIAVVSDSDDQFNLRDVTNWPASACVLDCAASAVSNEEYTSASGCIALARNSYLCFEGSDYICTDAVQCINLVDHITYIIASSCVSDVATGGGSTQTTSEDSSIPDIDCSTDDPDRNLYFARCETDGDGIHTCYEKGVYGYQVISQDPYKTKDCVDANGLTVYYRPHINSGYQDCADTVTTPFEKFDITEAVYNCVTLTGVTGWSSPTNGDKNVYACSLTGNVGEEYNCVYKDSCGYYHGCESCPGISLDTTTNYDLGDCTQSTGGQWNGVNLLTGGGYLCSNTVQCTSPTPITDPQYTLGLTASSVCTACAANSNAVNSVRYNCVAGTNSLHHCSSSVSSGTVKYCAYGSTCANYYGSCTDCTFPTGPSTVKYNCQDLGNQYYCGTGFPYVHDPFMCTIVSLNCNEIHNDCTSCVGSTSYTPVTAGASPNGVVPASLTAGSDVYYCRQATADCNSVYYKCSGAVTLNVVINSCLSSFADGTQIVYQSGITNTCIGIHAGTSTCTCAMDITYHGYACNCV